MTKKEENETKVDVSSICVLNCPKIEFFVYFEEIRSFNSLRKIFNLLSLSANRKNYNMNQNIFKKSAGHMYEAFCNRNDSFGKFVEFPSSTLSQSPVSLGSSFTLHG